MMSAASSISSMEPTVAVIWLYCTISLSRLPARLKTTRSPTRARSVSSGM